MIEQKTTIKNLALIAGVHGNELTPAYLVKYLQKSPNLIARSSFQSHSLIANPLALKQRVRYIDTDLNRCFNQKDLVNPDGQQYEQKRAKKIVKEIREKSIDLLIDIHSTTSNMMLAIIYSNAHPWLLKLFTYLTKINPEVRLIYHPVSEGENHFLKGICPLAFTLEIGPINHGVICPYLFRQTETLIYQILDYIEQENYLAAHLDTFSESLIVYQRLGSIDYPRDEQGEIKAMLHPEILQRDYQAIQPNQPIFLGFDGQEIIYRGESELYPIFVGEYYYK
ncbi:MAG: aspartoacylase [Microcystis sp.]|uniref:aspartoacylase n=1 Tax=Microcystis sp. TaxID=1127 RepID=UPI00391B068B